MKITTLSGQLLLGFAPILGLMLLLSVGGWALVALQIGAQRAVQRAQDSLAHGFAAQAGIAELEAARWRPKTPAEHDDPRPRIQLKKAYEAELGALKHLADDPLAQKRLAEIETLAEAWQESAPVAAQSEPLYQELRAKLEAYLGQERERLATLKQAARATGQRAAWLALAGTGLALGLAVAAMWTVFRRVRQQVGGEPAHIAALLEDVAQGNLDIDAQGGSGIAASLRQMVETLKDVAVQVNAIAAGDYSADLAARSERDELGIALRNMHTALRAAHAESAALDWLKTGLARLNEALRGDPTLDALAARAIAEVAQYLDAQVGALYIASEDQPVVLRLLGSYAYARRKNLSNQYRLGEGLVGQAALERQPILVRNVPEDYVRVVSGLGEAVPRVICVVPFFYQDRLKGVVEVGALGELGERELDYLRQAMPLLGVTAESAQARLAALEALEQAQQLTAELQAQQEELQTTNEELTEQAQRLQDSEERLKCQQEELQVSNEELEEKNALLEQQKRDMDAARKAIASKADELALASKYKSEFLANMSHELRTPLNSLLILAQSLADNQSGNLTSDQAESARVIHSSGSDLLSLINEILDLSKIEAGRMDLLLGAVDIQELADGLRASFAHMAESKGLSLDIMIDGAAPEAVSSDRRRIDQVLRNLMSNALKFTETGGITVRFARPAPGVDLAKSGLDPADALAVSVSDTGIGIASEQHKLIFEAFQQGDGGTARRFGGTGLGLTISRELAALLGGEIQLDSAPGRGSTFTFYLPAPPRLAVPVPKPAALPALAAIPDDREALGDADRVILVIEGDPRFAQILFDQCHRKGFKCLAAATGEAGLALAAQYLPCAAILDIHLPGIDGLAVLSALKGDTRTRHIPVHVVSADERVADSLRGGAVGHAVKPVDQGGLDGIFQRLEQVAAAGPKRVLVVEDNPLILDGTVKLLADEDIQIDTAETGAAALAALRAEAYDCVVLDLTLPDMDGREVLEALEREGAPLPPVVVHTARELSAAGEMGLRERADSIIVKDVRSPERLLDEVSLFLHRVVSRMPEPKRKIIRDLHESDALLRDRKVLVVDDDMRTLFAVSRLLTEWGMQPVKAENGERALRLLDEQPDVDLVLMDIMMPVLDGYAAMRRIRAQDRFRNLPIIALTAKAMPEDRQKCLEAGANDYLTKPIDTGRLRSLLRVWLYG